MIGGRLWTRGALLGVVLALSVPPAANAAGALSLTVNGKPGFRVTIEQLTANVDVPRDTQVTIRSANAPDQIAARGGTSVKRALELAGIDPAHVNELRLSRPNGTGFLTLSRNEILNGFDGDPLGHQQATFDGQYNNTEVRFFRPLRQDGAPNDDDELDPPTNANLVATFATDGPVLTVAIDPNEPRVASGDPVKLGATVSGGQGTPHLSWDFGDVGDTASGSSVLHTYPTDGTYSVTVTALTPDGGSGVATTDVVVGDTPPDGSPTGGGSGPQNGQAPTGGGAGKPTAPSTGPRRGRRDTEQGRRGQHRKATTDKPGGTSPPRSDATPTQTTPPPAHGNDSGQSLTPGGSGDPPLQSGDSHATPPTPGGSSAPVGGRPISGVLLASAGGGVDASALRAATARAAAKQLAARSAAAESQAVGWRVFGGAGLVLLLALGAVRELGVLPRRRTRRS